MRVEMKTSAVIILLITLTVGTINTAGAAIHYIRPAGTATWVQSTNRATPCTMSIANSNAAAGDTVCIAAGTYHAYIAPTHSGSAGHPITYINDGNGSVNITEAPWGVYLDSRSYIVVKGVAFTKVDAFLYIMHGANNNEIAFCTFDTVRNRTAWRGSTIFRGSSYNHVHHSRFSKYGECTNDDLGTVFDIGDEDDKTDLTCYNLIEECVMYHGGHHVLSVSGKYNVIRNNWLHNEPWAMGAANGRSRGDYVGGSRG
jgi:hypothetical protein